MGTRVEIGEPSILRTHVVCRKLFDEGCVRQAIEAGATLWVDSKPTDALVDDEGVTVSIQREGKELTLRSKLLCGADGVHSWTRRHFRFGRPKEFMIGFQAELAGFEGPPLSLIHI